MQNKILDRREFDPRTAAIITLKQIVVNAPAELREHLEPLADKALIERCARLRRRASVESTFESAKHTLRALARRWLSLAEEITAHDNGRCKSQPRQYPGGDSVGRCPANAELSCRPAGRQAGFDKLLRCVAKIVSWSSGCRPGVRPGLLATAMPSQVRSEMSRRLKCAMAPKRWNTRSPAVEEVSRRSSRLTRWMPRALRLSTVSSCSRSERPRRSSLVPHRRSPARARAVAYAALRTESRSRFRKRWCSLRRRARLSLHRREPRTKRSSSRCASSVRSSDVSWSGSVRVEPLCMVQVSARTPCRRRRRAVSPLAASCGARRRRATAPCSR